MQTTIGHIATDRQGVVLIILIRPICPSTIIDRTCACIDSTLIRNEVGLRKGLVARQKNTRKDER